MHIVIDDRSQADDGNAGLQVEHLIQATTWVQRFSRVGTGAPGAEPGTEAA